MSQLVFILIRKHVLRCCLCDFRGATDRFEFSSKELGDIASICLGHIPKDGKKVKVEASWFVEEVVVTEKELGNK